MNEGQQQMVKGGGGLPPDMSTLEESSFKVGRLSVEERKEKIHRYLKKRNERNFSKKIKVSNSSSSFVSYISYLLYMLSLIRWLSTDVRQVKCSMLAGKL